MRARPAAVLIVGSPRDPHVAAVSRRLRESGRRAAFLDTESMEGARGLSAAFPRPGAWGWGGRSSREGAPAWYRRAPFPEAFKRVQPRYRGFVESEFRDALTACLRSLRVRWLSPPESVHAAENKPHQLRVAAECGLRVPATLITSNPREARGFARRFGDGVVVKPIASPFSRRGASRAIYTTRLAKAHLERLDDARTCPILLQAFIPKMDEWRVTVVGRRVLAVSIRPRRGADFPVDWRTADPRDLEHRAIRTPAAFERSVLRMVRALGLGFCSMDAVVGRDGVPRFLDLNPGGQWLWLEEAAGVPISRAIADWLSSAER